LATQSVSGRAYLGFESAPIRDIRIEDSTFNNVARPDVIEHVEGLKLTKVTVNGKAVT